MGVLLVLAAVARALLSGRKPWLAMWHHRRGGTLGIVCSGPALLQVAGWGLCRSFAEHRMFPEYDQVVALP